MVSLIYIPCNQFGEYISDRVRITHELIKQETETGKGHLASI
jgi:hypothetical protein